MIPGEVKLDMVTSKAKRNFQIGSVLDKALQLCKEKAKQKIQVIVYVKNGKECNDLK